MSGIGLWGAPDWVLPAGILLAVAVVAVARSYWRNDAGDRNIRALAAALKALGLAALALCLTDPLLSGVRPRRGANIFAIVVDDSQSLQIHDRGVEESRGQRMQSLLLAETPWQSRLCQDFDVRRLAFGTQLRAVDDFSALGFDVAGTSVSATLVSLARRFRGLPIAGILLLTDGNATDALAADVPWADLPPIYAVAIGADDKLVDVSVERVSASEANFEAAPITIRADVRTTGVEGEPLVVAIVDEAGKTVETQTARAVGPDQSATVRFQMRPETAGVSFYTIDARLESEASASAPTPPPKTHDRRSIEATLANNRRLVAVDRGGGPYRVLYGSGRPNWEFKFLRRALADDDQLELVGLIRIALREPRFSFRNRDQQSNQLFEGFEHPDDDAAESYDEPVIVRLGTKDESELRDGFPRTAEELYVYDALVLDDLEAAFFTQDQLNLIDDFVSRRGGGLLMLGGAESFSKGAYRRTPVADVLPVYLDSVDAAPAPPVDQRFRLALTRDGWLEPWVRLRKTEPEDRERLAAMTPFHAVNPVGRLKPGATVLAQVLDDAGDAYPALVAQRYGRGRAAALMIGDLWRWGLSRRDENDVDLERSWRQTIRWLVGDVPKRVEVEVTGAAESSAGAMALHVRVRDEEYLPLDNAEATVCITAPDQKQISLEAQPSTDEAGAYLATHVPRFPGAYRAEVEVKAADGQPIGVRTVGWAAQPIADEFNRLSPNHQLLAEIAAKTKGEVIDADDLDDFVATLDSRPAPITEPWTRPLWHHPLFFLVTIGCLTAEWGLRRWKGLA